MTDASTEVRFPLYVPGSRNMFNGWHQRWRAARPGAGNVPSTPRRSSTHVAGQRQCRLRPNRPKFAQDFSCPPAAVLECLEMSRHWRRNIAHTSSPAGAPRPGMAYPVGPGIRLPRSGRFVGLDNTVRAREWPVDRPSRTMPTRTMPTRSCRPGRSRKQDAGTGRRRPRAGPVVAGSRPVRTHPGAAAARASRRVVGCTGGPRYSSARRIRLVAYGARLECVLG